MISNSKNCLSDYHSIPRSTCPTQPRALLGIPQQQPHSHRPQCTIVTELDQGGSGDRKRGWGGQKWRERRPVGGLSSAPQPTVLCLVFGLAYLGDLIAYLGIGVLLGYWHTQGDYQCQLIITVWAVVPVNGFGYTFILDYCVIYIALLTLQKWYHRPLGRQYFSSVCP